MEIANLLPVLARPPFPEYLRRLWARRFFIAADARARVDAASRATLLGKVWLVLNPLLDAVVYFVIFGLILNSSRGIPNFVGYLIIGVFLFQWTTKCLTQGSRSITGGRALIRAFAFPRAALPVATVTRVTLQFIPALLTMLVIILAIPWVMPMLNGNPVEVHVGWRWLLVPMVLALQLAMNLGLAFVAARVCARIPDLQQVITILCRFWLYTSAVFFSIDRFEAVPWLQTVMHLNPMYLVLDMVRDCLLYGVTPSWTSWVLLGVWSIGLLAVGSLVFWMAEERYGES